LGQTDKQNKIFILRNETDKQNKIFILRGTRTSCFAYYGASYFDSLGVIRRVFKVGIQLD